jgi:hypothetical protein
MDNMISINIPRNVAENLHGILHAGATAGQARPNVAEAETEKDKEDSEAGDGLREILANADFSKDEQKAVLAKRMLPKVEEDKLIKDLGFVAHLIECRRIYLGV